MSHCPVSMKNGLPQDIASGCASWAPSRGASTQRLGFSFARLPVRKLALLLKTTPRQLTQRYAPFELLLLA